MESEDSDPNKWILAGVCLLLADDWSINKVSNFKFNNLIYIYKLI